MANEKRLIDANALKTKVFNFTLYVPWLRFGKTAINIILESYRKGVFEEIDNAPTVEAVEVVHGRWIIDKEHFKATCSNCGKVLRFSDEMQIVFIRDEERFCYYCGAKMDGDGNG